jgi:hypothetical protein
MLREFLIKVSVPKWATYYSIDKNGFVYYYEYKPEVDEDEDDTMWIANGRIEFSGIILESNLFGDWRETLREIRWAA